MSVDVRCLLFLFPRSFFTSRQRRTAKRPRDSRESSRIKTHRADHRHQRDNRSDESIRRALIDHSTGSIKEYKRTPFKDAASYSHACTSLWRLTMSFHVRTFPSRSLDGSYRLLRAIVEIVVRNVVRSPPDVVRQASGYEWHSLSEIRWSFKKGSIDIFISFWYRRLVSRRISHIEKQ